MKTAQYLSFIEYFTFLPASGRLGRRRNGLSESWRSVGCFGHHLGCFWSTWVERKGQRHPDGCLEDRQHLSPHPQRCHADLERTTAPACCGVLLDRHHALLGLSLCVCSDRGKGLREGGSHWRSDIDRWLGVGGSEKALIKQGDVELLVFENR